MTLANRTSRRGSRRTAGTATTFAQRRMIVCAECGNKRCPKATHHDNACTGSNAPGQPGSRCVVAEYSRVIRRPPAGTSGQED